MLFDSGVHFFSIILYSAVSAYPVAVIGSSIAAWILFYKNKKRIAHLINHIPGLWVIAGVVSTLIVYLQK